MSSPIHAPTVTESGGPIEYLGVQAPAAEEKQLVDRVSKAQVVDHHSWVEESGLTDSGAGDSSLRHGQAAGASLNSRAP